MRWPAPRSRLGAAAAVVAFVAVAAFVVNPAVVSPPTTEEGPSRTPTDVRLVQPHPDNPRELWPYTSRQRRFETLTLPMNVVVHEDARRTRRVLEVAGAGAWKEGPPGGEAAQVNGTGVAWDETTGATRYTYVEGRTRGHWEDETAQVHDGDYLGARYHLRLYQGSRGPTAWTAVQAHHEHWDWFRLRHTVGSLSRGRHYVEQDFYGSGVVEHVSRERFGNGGISDADGWVTVFELRPGEPRRNPERDDGSLLGGGGQSTPTPGGTPTGTDGAGGTANDTGGAGPAVSPTAAGAGPTATDGGTNATAGATDTATAGTGAGGETEAPEATAAGSTGARSVRGGGHAGDASGPRGDGGEPGTGGGRWYAAGALGLLAAAGGATATGRLTRALSLTRRTVAAAALFGALALAPPAIRFGSVWLERQTALGAHPKVIAGLFYPLLAVGVPVVAAVVGHLLRAEDAFAAAVVGLGVGFLLDYGALGISVVPVEVVTHRAVLLVAVGLIAAGGTRWGEAWPRRHRYRVVGVVLWVAALAWPLAGL